MGKIVDSYNTKKEAESAAKRMSKSVRSNRFGKNTYSVKKNSTSGFWNVIEN
jgi:hypothetical protein